jgi:trigger factor
LRAKVLEIKERRLPDLNDLAASFDAESVEKLREMVKSKMQEGAEDVANRQLESQLLFRIVENSEICFPESLLHEESELRFQDLLRRLGEAKVELTRYLRRMDQTLDELREEIDRNAERDLREHLALLEIAEREKITVSDEDIEAEIQKMADARGVPKPSMQAYIDSSNGAERISMRLLRGKALDFLLHASNIKNVAAKGDSL